MTDQTPRLQLPLLAAGQAQKELFHNEALALLDAAVSPCVLATGLNQPPVAPASGQCWIVGDAPAGDWAGQAGAIAAWTGGGWRFVPATEGLAAWLASDELPLRFTGGAWRRGELRATALVVSGVQVVGAQQPAIASPSGGTTVDAEARAALAAVLVALKTHGLIKP